MGNDSAAAKSPRLEALPAIPELPSSGQFEVLKIDFYLNTRTRVNFIVHNTLPLSKKVIANQPEGFGMILRYHVGNHAAASQQRDTQRG